MGMCFDRLRPFSVLCVGLLVGLVQGCAASPADPVALGMAAGAADDGPGRIEEAPTNLRRFSPETTLTTVDAGNINLRQVFEDLGPDATLWYQHVQTLANPFFEGRQAGSRGFELATEYVEFYMTLYGLEPAFPAAEDEELGGATDAAWVSYRQPFQFGGFPRREFDLQGEFLAIGDATFDHGSDFVVLPQSGGEMVTAGVTFCGYAIAEGEDGYTSFEDDTDLEGRIALVLGYEPLNDEGESQWSDRRFSRRASVSRKVDALTERGAAAVIVVNPPGAVDGSTTLPRLGRRASGEVQDIPVVQVSADVAEYIFELGDREGHDLHSWRRGADLDEINTFDLSDDLLVTVSGQSNMVVKRSSFESYNVGGVLRGKGDLADKWIVLGGHYDHVGYGRGNGSVHPGADDNASGTSGMLILAKRLTEHYAQSDDDDDLRSILFMAFGAEEAGLRGSAHYVKEPTLDLEDISLMINMDMIGRLRSNEIMLGGTGTAEEYDELLLRHVEPSGLIVKAQPQGRGPSDHSNFFGAGVPVLFFFSGLHAEYHQPGDHAYTVDPIGAIRAVDLAESITMDVVSRAEQLTYVGE